MKLLGNIMYLLKGSKVAPAVSMGPIPSGPAIRDFFLGCYSNEHSSVPIVESIAW
jgi:hypothetical protein